MQELRFVAVSEDGRYAVLAVPGRSARFTLPIDERLRAVALGQTSRLAQYEIEVESPLRPKEIQARIRAGETVEEIADAAGIAVERVRWFEGPVLAERAYMADKAQLASVRRPGDAIPSSPGPRLGEIVTERLKVFGADPEEAQWDARKLGDGSWLVQLTFITGGRLHHAEWNFDPRRRHVVPADDNASRMSLPGGEPPMPAAPAPGEATVTHLAPRLSSAGGYGNGAMAGGAVGNGTSGGFGNGLGNGGRARHERPAPVRTEPRYAESEAPEPKTPEPQVAQVAEPQAAGPRSAEPQAAEPQPAEYVVTESEAPELHEDDIPAAAPPVPSAPPVSPAPVSPATVAAQTSRNAPPVPARAADAVRAATPPAAEPEAPVAPAAEVPAVAQPVGEQAVRPGRKTARGRRSSVPSWDEIMFGNSRQRD
ncbi:MAG TPA: septation protein SepH [Streptosporangiaceae bacterium]|nr:septation protein SepH [Streptosporangiaceae bacterium]